MSEPQDVRPYGDLTKDQLIETLQRKYSVHQYLEEAFALCARVRRSEEGERSFLERRGPAKQLCDEMLPLGYLAKYFLSNWPGTELQLVLGSQPYDALVTHRYGFVDLPSHIEVTCLDRPEDHKRRAALAATGMVIDTFNEAQRLIEMSDLLRRAIKRKSGKPYPSGTLLLIFQKTKRRLDGWMNVVVDVSEELRTELSCFRRVIVMNEHSIDLDFRP